MSMSKSNNIIKLARMTDGKETEFIIPIMEASFRIHDNYKGVITWDKEVFDVNLENEKNKQAWDKWIAKKEELSSKILKSHEIQQYVQDSIVENVKALFTEMRTENEKLRKELDDRSEKVRKELDERTEKIRSEYKAVQRNVQEEIANLVVTLGSMVQSVKEDTTTIKENAVDMGQINKDFKKIQKTFNEILETE